MIIFSNSGAWEPYSTCETWSISEYSNSEIQKHSHDSKWWWCWLMTFWIYGAPGLNRLNLSIFVVIILSIKLVDFHNSAVLNTIYWERLFLICSWAELSFQAQLSGVTGINTVFMATYKQQFCDLVYTRANRTRSPRPWQGTGLKLTDYYQWWLFLFFVKKTPRPFYWFGDEGVAAAVFSGGHGAGVCWRLHSNQPTAV